MCVVSMVIDYYKQRWSQYDNFTLPSTTFTIPLVWPPAPLPALSPEVFEKMLKFLERAQEMDKITQDPDCEDPAKVEWLRKMAASFDGVDQIDRLFPREAQVQTPSNDELPFC